MQRKKAVIAQLNNLKGLAGEAESAYPDTDPFAEEADGETTDDATIVMSPKSSQAQQKSTDSQTDQTTHSAGNDGEAAHLDDPASQRTQVIPAVKKDGESAQPSSATAADEADNEKTQVLSQGTKSGK